MIKYYVAQMDRAPSVRDDREWGNDASSNLAIIPKKQPTHKNIPSKNFSMIINQSKTKPSGTSTECFYLEKFSIQPAGSLDNKKTL